MDKFWTHKEISKGKYLFRYSIPNASSIDYFNIKTEKFYIGKSYSYYVTLTGLKDKISFRLTSDSKNFKCSFSMFIGSSVILSSYELNSLPKANSEDYTMHDYEYELKLYPRRYAGFSKSQDHQNESLVIICRIENMLDPSDSVKMRHFSYNQKCISPACFNNLKKLAADFKSSPKLLKERVLLKVGEEIEAVNKAVLCARSPVFAKMFESDMQELRQNTVSITDIKMPVLRALVSFLYTGKLTNFDFDFLCDLYYAADKYDMIELRQSCVELLLPKISMDNVLRALKLALSHNIELLKIHALAFIAENIEAWVSRDDWKNLLNDEPEISIEILNF